MNKQLPGLLLMAIGALFLGIAVGVIPLSSVGANPTNINGMQVLDNSCFRQFGAGGCNTIYYAWTGTELSPSQGAMIVGEYVHQTYTSSCDLPFAVYQSNIPIVMGSGGIPDAEYVPLYGTGTNPYLQMFVVNGVSYIEWTSNYGAPDGCGPVTYSSTTMMSSTTHTTTSKTGGGGFGLPGGLGIPAATTGDLFGIAGLVLFASGFFVFRGRLPE